MARRDSSQAVSSALRLDYVPRTEALRILAVKPQTLYSYVSRGLVRRLPHPDRRSSYYNREDIERLKARSAARSGHGPVAASAIHWGEPVLVTSITEITPSGPRYRERLAADLAHDNVPFEAVAEYLWTGRMSEPAGWTGQRRLDVLAAQLGDVVRLHPHAHIRQLLTEVVLLLGMEDEEASEHELCRAKSLIRAMVGAFGFLGPRRSFVALRDDESIAHGLARALGVQPTLVNLHALNAALVLFADHEFTPATFTARIAASAGSDLYSCIAAALPVHFGSGLGARCDRIDQAIDPSLFARRRGIDAVLRSARTPYGLVHPLYSAGDPRAKQVVALGLRVWRGSPLRANIDARGDGLTMEESLVLLCRALGAVQQAAGGLLAFARVAGWIAHVVEQRQERFLIRPRGKFIPRHESC